jgi:pimeloyl-ACP methyl ester carboxylesterase
MRITPCRFGGVDLAGTLFQPDDDTSARGAILFLHGWGRTQTDHYERAEALCAQEYYCFTFDFHGHGESKGRKTVFSLLDHLVDAKEAYDYLIESISFAAFNLSIGAVGTSYGAPVAVLLSKLRPIDSLVLRAPALYRNEDLVEQHPEGKERTELEEWRRHEILPVNNTLLSAAMHVKSDVLLVESERDEHFPAEVMRSYVAAFQSRSGPRFRHYTMKDAPHRLETPELNAEFIRLLLEWFST